MLFKPLLAFLSFLAIGSLAFGEVTFAFNADDGAIVERRAYSFPSYEEAAGATEIKNYASKDEYQRAVSDPNFELQKLRYKSDGLKVIAYLYKPVRTDGRKFPAIIFNRGSTVR